MPMFVPGPVDVDPEILAAQSRPTMPHRSKEYEEIFHRAENNARKLFFTDHRVIITASSGTGFHEAAVRNFVPDDGRILSLTNGAFGNRWHEVALTNGKTADKIETEWNVPVTADLVAEQITKHKYDILCVVHNETSVGVMNPVKEIAAVVHELSPDTLICVDAVSSLGGYKLEMDAWGVDMILTSSQKTLALPPGLGLAAVSDRALEKAKTVPNRGWYFDLVRMENYRIKNSTPATSAVNLVYALDVQLLRILEEGLENRFARYAGMAARVHAWAEEKGWGLWAPEGYRSMTVTTVNKPEWLNMSQLNAYLLERDMRVAGGYGPIKPKTFRIAHMGELQMTDMDTLLTTIDAFEKEVAIAA